MTMLQIASAVGRLYQVSLGDMRSASQRSKITNARAVAMYLCREKTAHSLPEIGRFFGGKHHTSVLYQHGRIADAAQKDERLRAFLDSIVPTASFLPEYGRVLLPEDYGITTGAVEFEEVQ